MGVYSVQLKRKKKGCKQGHISIKEFIEPDLKSPNKVNSLHKDKKNKTFVCVCVYMCTCTCIKQCAFEDGEMMAWWLRTLAAFSEDPSPAPSTIKWLTTTFNASFTGCDTLFCLLQAPAHMWYTLSHTHMYISLRINKSWAGRGGARL